jgi:anti-anti-sigma factor
LSASVRAAGSQAAVIDLAGQVTGQGESAVMDAHNQATSHGARLIVLNFTDVEYMNSGGIGLLVMLLIRVNRHGQRLVAVGLSDHYEHIFQLTRLNEAIQSYRTEADALTAAGTAERR